MKYGGSMWGVQKPMNTDSRKREPKKQEEKKLSK